MQLSFVVSMANPRDSQCFDKITPHDMYSSYNCALSGAFVVGGGWAAVMWVFLRTLSLHLQICWQVVPGRKFFLGSQAAGWTIPVVFLAIALSISGVSYRFGESCHINSNHGIQTFWGPMLAVAAASIVTQSITFGYVAQVYLRSLFEEKPATTQASGNSRNLYSGSIRTVNAFQALRRIRKVIALQWRGIFVVIIILADVIFFSTVFLQFDGTTQATQENKDKAMYWIFCMLGNDGDKNKCLAEARQMVVSEWTAFSVLFLLSFNGIWALILLGRFSIYPAWITMIKKFFERGPPPDEFVSYNARRISEPTDSSYEMLESKRRDTASTADLAIMKPEPSAVRGDQLTSTLREYNPSTFSAQMRGMSGTGIDSQCPFSSYRDLEPGSRSPTTSSQFSPFRDNPLSPDNDSNSPFSPYVDSPTRTPVLERGRPRYQDDVRIGFAQ